MKAIKVNGITRNAGKWTKAWAINPHWNCRISFPFLKATYSAALHVVRWAWGTKVGCLLTQTWALPRGNGFHHEKELNAHVNPSFIRRFYVTTLFSLFSHFHRWAAFLLCILTWFSQTWVIQGEHIHLFCTNLRLLLTWRVAWYFWRNSASKYISRERIPQGNENTSC